ncbi:MAG: hypothetical protein HY901_19070 [Deltaproteobacteria bacterium]|nr:hypothetical protein [Deltaproteobacteria bacterium]
MNSRTPSTPRARLPELVAGLVFLAASVALTWPMAEHFGSRLGGDPGDPFQTLWSWRWMHDALTHFSNPFFSDRVFHPQGAPLVFQTFDTPTAILTVPLWWFLSPFGVYNAGVLFAFWLTAYGMYRLVKELTGDRLVAVCAGVLFTAAPYHLAHAQGHQHLTSMGWLPLYFLFLHRMLEGRARLRDAVLGGLFLALASLASWYHLLFAMVASAVLFGDAAIRLRPTFLTKAFAARAVVLAATYLAVAGPLLIAILVYKSREPIAGAHDAVRFSGDLYAFFFPNLAQSWAHWWGGHAFRWSGNAAETALYAGYAVLFAALIGLFLGGGTARVWLAVALLGAVLALGPKLHVDGQIREVTLPYAWLEKLMPQLEFMGVPVRLGYLMYLGLIVCGALGLARLRGLLASRSGRFLVALVPTAFALVEYTPRRFIVTAAEAPKPMVEWAEDPQRFAVLDISDDYRMMWHAAVHRKPMTGGNLTRVPDRLESWYWSQPVIQAIRRPGAFRVEPVLERVDPRIDFWWGGAAPDPKMRADAYRVEWTGRVEVPREGEWTFHLTSDDASRLELEGGLVADNGGAHPMQTRSGKVKLGAGAHPLRLVFEQLGGDAGMKLEWEGPGQPRQVVPGEALHTTDGQPGLRGSYLQGSRECAIDRAEGRSALRELHVRYVVTGLSGNDCLARKLQLPETYRGEGVRIFEVPATD